MAPRKKEKLSPAAAAVFAQKHLGEEPVWTTDQATDAELTKALSWYNYFVDSKKSKTYALDYLRSQQTGPKLLAQLEKLPHHGFRHVGYVSRMLARGCSLSDERRARYKADVLALIAKAREAANASVEASEKPAEMVPLNSLADKVAEIIGGVEALLDAFIIGGYKAPFNCYEHLTKNEVKSANAKRIAEFYAPLAQELYDAIKKTDKQVVEAYSNYSTFQLRAYYGQVYAIIEDCNRVVGNAKATRKPRAKKAVTVEKVVAKVNYKESDDKYKIKSINPSEIVGAKSLWVFNTETRKLSQYMAKDDTGLSVKGTTVLNFDETKSIQKNLRKPEEFLSRVLTGGLVQLRHLMKDIRAKDAPVSGRINRDTVLLRVIK